MFETYKLESEIPEGLKEHYVEKNGVWAPDGFVGKDKLDEFRKNNRDLAKAKETLQKQLLTYKDIDPEKYAEHLEKLKVLEDKSLEDAGEWKVLKVNLELTHAEEMKKEKMASAQVQKGWNAEKIANATAITVMKHALPAEGNMPYIQSDIQRIAAIDSDTNEIVFLDEKGLKIKNEAGDANLTLDEYLTKTYIPKSNLFQKSEGSGGLGGKDVQLTGPGQVGIDSVSGKDIPASMIDDLASGKLKAV